MKPFFSFFFSEIEPNEFPGVFDSHLSQVNVTHIHFARSLLPQLMGALGNMSRTVYSEGGYQYFREFEPNDPEQKHAYDDPHGK